MVTENQVHGQIYKVVGCWNEYVDIRFYSQEKLVESLVNYKPALGDICRAEWEGTILLCYAVMSITNQSWDRFYIGPFAEEANVAKLVQKFVLSDFVRFHVKPPDYTLRSGNNVLRRFRERLRNIENIDEEEHYGYTV
jgi:hypothetical protein